MSRTRALLRIPMPPTLVTRPAARAALYSCLAVWGSLTVLRSMDRSANLLSKFTRFGLTVPNYRFFGPTPAMHDLGLLVRHRAHDGTLTGWNEVIFGQDRRLVHTVWAPHRRAEKAMTDATREIGRIGNTVLGIDFIPSTTGYQLLLNVVRHQVAHDADAVAVQFALCQSAAHEPQVAPQLTYVSMFHDLATGEIATERTANADVDAPRPAGRTWTP